MRPITMAHLPRQTLLFEPFRRAPSRHCRDAVRCGASKGSRPVPTECPLGMFMGMGRSRGLHRSPGKMALKSPVWRQQIRPCMSPNRQWKPYPCPTRKFLFFFFFLEKSSVHALHVTDIHAHQFHALQGPATLACAGAEPSSVNF